MTPLADPHRAGRRPRRRSVTRPSSRARDELGTNGPTEPDQPRGGAEMADVSSDAPALTNEELMQEGAEELPDREAMSLVNANVAAPINAAVALNALSDGSTAAAVAQQTAPITQTN